MLMFAAETDVWRYQPHPEVWALIVGAIGLGWYAVRVVGPNAVRAGQPVVTQRNVVAYVAAVFTLWVASDWPMHDISEEYLYSAHMLQHLIITFGVPPLLLLAMPEWLARLILAPGGELGVWIKRLANPVVAGVIFNLVIAASHLTNVVNTSVANGPFHYAVHTVVFAAALLMWMPVVGPIEELRMGLPGQMFYLFLMSIVPTVPAAFLTFATGALYSSYDHGVRLWDISVTDDQQVAGFIMKLVGGTYLWTWIIILFYRWTNATRGSRDLVPVLSAGPPTEGDGAADVTELTFETVQAEFDRTGPAPTGGPKTDL